MTIVHYDDLSSKRLVEIIEEQVLPLPHTLMCLLAEYLIPDLNPLKIAYSDMWFSWSVKRSCPNQNAWVVCFVPGTQKIKRCFWKDVHVVRERQSIETQWRWPNEQREAKTSLEELLRGTQDKNILKPLREKLYSSGLSCSDLSDRIRKYISQRVYRDPTRFFQLICVLDIMDWFFFPHQKNKNMKTIPVTDGIHVIHNFTEDPEMFKKMSEQCRFQSFSIHDKVLCRTGSFEGDQIPHPKHPKGVTPWLRCPSSEHQVIYPWSECVAQVRDKIQKVLGYQTNIAKIQNYPSGKADITAHCDKILDLDQKTPIFIARFGATRKCQLIHKLSGQEIVVEEPNGLLVISYEANLVWLHGILKERSVTEPSYSIVFRQSVTFTTPDHYVFGPRTPFPTVESLHHQKSSDQTTAHYMTKEEQTTRLIQCFSKENHTFATLDIYQDIIKRAVYA
jgi:hypothetical protein